MIRLPNPTKKKHAPTTEAQLRVDELESFASSNIERLRQQGADLGRAVADRLATFAAVMGGMHARQTGAELAGAALVEEGTGRWEALAAAVPAPDAAAG